MSYSRFKDKGGTSISRWNVAVCWLLFHWLKKHFTDRNLSLILHVINYYILSIDPVIVCAVKQETRSWLWPTAAVQDTAICRYMLCKLCILGKQQSFRWCLSVETPLSYWNCQLLFIKIRGGGVLESVLRSECDRWEHLPLKAGGWASCSLVWNAQRICESQSTAFICTSAVSRRLPAHRLRFVNWANSGEWLHSSARQQYCFWSGKSPRRTQDFNPSKIYETFLLFKADIFGCLLFLALWFVHLSLGMTTERHVAL